MQEIISKIKGIEVLVIGDVMLDRFVYGDSSRISPEAPVPVLRVDAEKTMLGGAANVISNLAGLDAKPMLLGLIGEDAEGQSFKSLLRDIGVSDEYLIQRQNFQTTTKTRYIAQNQQLLRVDDEDTNPINDEIFEAAKNLFDKALEESKCVVISDYNKGFLRPDFMAYMIAQAKAQNIPVLVDPKSSDYTIYSGADVITPNKKELAEASHMDLKADSDFEKSALSIIEKFDIGCVVATRSEDGISIFEKSKDPVHMPTQVQEVYDVSGAGDTVVAVLSACLAAGTDMPQAAQAANIAGGVVVGKLGTAAIQANDILTHNPQTPMAHKIMDRETAKDIVADWQAQGLKVGFTNGCFDIVHYGHVNYLAVAAQKCDRLILGLNTDSSVTRLKGEGRPINDQIARATVLAAMVSTDLVIFFGDHDDDQDIPVSVISHLKPDIIFKGGDYTVGQLPEAKVVLAYGGEVDIMPLYDGYSTTAIAAKAGGKKV